jgi:hypothetical protein
VLRKKHAVVTGLKRPLCLSQKQGKYLFIFSRLGGVSAVQPGEEFGLHTSVKRRPIEGYARPGRAAVDTERIDIRQLTGCSDSEPENLAETQAT